MVGVAMVSEVIAGMVTASALLDAEPTLSADAEPATRSLPVHEVAKSAQEAEPAQAVCEIIRRREV